MISLRWRHNERDGVSNHRRNECFLNRLFGRRPKKTSKLRVTGLCEGNPPVTGHLRKVPVTRKMFSFGDVIMWPRLNEQNKIGHNDSLVASDNKIVS